MVKVLIADDEDTARLGLKALVESFGLELRVVALAEDGQQALTLAQKLLPEILLVDINMPRLSGLELIERLRGVLPDSKMIIISGYGEFGYAQRAVELNVFRYLLKPLKHDQLLNALCHAMESYSSRMWELNQLGDGSVDLLSSGELPSKVLHYIDTHYSDSELSLQTLADAFNVSKSYLSRIFKEQTGSTFPAYLTNLRMERAVRLLRESRHLMIYAVAGQVGYASQHYFCKVFKEYTGLSPSEYRMAVLEKSPPVGGELPGDFAHGRAEG